MAVNNVDISTNERLQFNGDSINSGIINREFGRPEDFIELHIYNQQNQLLISDENFKLETILSKSCQLLAALPIPP